MDDGLKQRLIGAVILLGVGVLFIPTLFEPGSQRKIDITPQVPPAPNIKPLVLERPEPSPDIEMPKSSSEMYRLVSEPEVQPDEVAAEPNKNAIKAVELDQKGVPRAWVVQVSSYKSEQTAEAFLKRLRGDGYKAFSKTLDTSKGRVTRVFVGPKISREQVDALKREVDRKYGVTAMILRFEP